MTLKVLFIRTDACTLDPRIQKEAESLVRAGYAVSVFGWDRKAEYLRREEIRGVTYRRSRLSGPYGSRWLAVVLPLFWLRVWVAIARARPDVVHACDFDALIPSLLARLFIRKALVYDVFDTLADKINGIPAALRSLLRWADRTLMRFPDAVIVVDDERRRLLAGVVVRQLHVIMNVPPSIGAPIAAPIGREFVLCYAGSIHAHRGLHLIAEAVRDLPGVTTVFAGWIPRVVDRDFLLAEKHIRYLGKLPYSESLELMAHSNAVLALYDPELPINAQASSNKVFEAMAVARPVITNVETPMARIVREEGCGCLVSYGDRSQLRNVITQLRDSPELCAKLGRNGLKAFEDKYNWHIMEERLIAMYGALVQGSS